MKTMKVAGTNEPANDSYTEPTLQDRINALERKQRDTDTKLKQLETASVSQFDKVCKTLKRILPDI